MKMLFYIWFTIGSFCCSLIMFDEQSYVIGCMFVIAGICGFITLAKMIKDQ